jgi:hypothetical protein
MDDPFHEELGTPQQEQRFVECQKLSNIVFYAQARLEIQFCLFKKRYT